MPKQFEQRPYSFAAGLKVAMVLMLVLGATGTAAGQIIYNSIPSPLPGNVASEGPEAYAFRELGDGLIFAGTRRSLTTITVTMSDWACTSGHWFNKVGTPNPCVTTPGATFQQPITINIYKVTGLVIGPLLFTKTVTFTIPYRPSSDPVHCVPLGNPGGDGEQWFSAKDNTCYHGFAFPITFDFTGDGVVLDSQNVVTLAFNTSTAGPSPIGTGAPCFTSSGGCPYDSLNISTDGTLPSVGTDIDPNGFWANYISPANSCGGAAATGHVIDDTPCNTKFHPQILVDTTPNEAFQIGYAANLLSGDSFVDLTNAGTLGGLDPAGDICANLYVLAPDQELIACCSCPLTPNHVKGVSVRKDLTGNPIHAGPFDAVSIVVTASRDTPCDPSQVVNFAPGLKAWGTTLHAKPGGGFANTETKFQIAAPSASELNKLTSFCGFIQSGGSGHGICGACVPGVGTGGLVQ